jgi:peptide deformylase
MEKIHDVLVLHGHRILAQTLPVLDKNNISSEELSSLLSNMNAIMLKHNGVGLAANQIGRSERIFIAKSDSGYSCFINPVILSYSGSVESLDEGCLSVPGVSSQVERHKMVELQWQDEQWRQHAQQFEGLMAQIIQHEVDHLNGKLYIDHFKPLKRQTLLDKHKKHLRSINKSRFNRS